MNQKLIFLDIDGTLTEPGKNVPPPSAVEAVRRAREKGHKVVLCSGRNYGMLFPVLEFGFDGLVASAGGYIEYGGQVVYDCPMTSEQQKKVLDVFKESGIYRTIGGRNCSYTDEGFKEFLAANAQSRANSELLRWRIQIESELGIHPMSEYDGEPIYGMAFMSRGKERLEKPMQELQDEFDFCIQDQDACGIVNGELASKAFNKGKAVERLCGFLGVSRKDTIAVGDSMNDLEMLQAVETAVCMANGSPALQKLAHMVCPPVTEDGLYHAFEKLQLI
ncbi:MAG: HAD family hydrolase [Lachnospiraceae bacterium]|nr:HAD family hydrolase [Lachnospiraceae bacterium]